MMDYKDKKQLLLEGIKKSLPLDKDFSPAILWNNLYLEYVNNSNTSIPVSIAIEKDKDSILVYDTLIFKENSTENDSINRFYIEKLIKTLLWIYGGHKIIIAGSKKIGEHISKIYSKAGKRHFDTKTMSKICESPFIVETLDIENLPVAREKSIPLGRHLDGCRIGFDLGASDIKVSAVIEGEAIFSDEIVWDPGNQKDPGYHYHNIMSVLHKAAAYLPRVDAIGGSSAGIYTDNRVMAASLFRAIPDKVFNKEVKDMFLKIQRKWDVPLKIINDGEVTALAGSMSLDKNKLIGIAMGSSEAGGYIDGKGNIKPWINELAFVPIDFSPRAPIDEWSGDIGCGVQYFSQQAVVRLAEKSGIILDGKRTPAQKLKDVQELMGKNDNRCRKIFETIGGYLGYTIPYYANFYEIGTVLILGRVTSGEGGEIILQRAVEILNNEFPELSIDMHLPDEYSRRIGQSIAAASLPVINK